MTAKAFSTYIYVDSVNIVRGARDATGDRHWTLDFRRLKKFLGVEESRAATVYMARRDGLGQIMDAAYASGFDVVLGRDAIQGERGVDVSMAVDAIEDACTDAARGDRFMLVTGDGDFEPVVERLRKRGMVVDVVSVRACTSGALIRAANAYTDLTPSLDYLGYNADHYPGGAGV